MSSIVDIFLVYLGVDTGVVPLSTSVAPGHNTLQLTVAHDGSTRVSLRENSFVNKCTNVLYMQLRCIVIGKGVLQSCFVTHLARVLASLQVSSAEHDISDHAGVRVITVPVGQDGDVQALQFVAVSSCNFVKQG